MLTVTSASAPSWSNHTVARVAHAYGVSPATLVSRRRDPVLVEARRVAMGLVVERAWVPAGSARSFIVITALCFTTWSCSGKVARRRNRRCSPTSGSPSGARRHQIRGGQSPHGAQRAPSARAARPALQPTTSVCRAPYADAASPVGNGAKCSVRHPLSVC